MSVFYIVGEERRKFRHHQNVQVLPNKSVAISEEMSGCEEQVFSFDKPKTMRFRLETVEFDADRRKLRVWYVAASVRTFFKVSIRLEEPYVQNIGEIGEQLATTFLNLPKGLARGMIFDDIPGNITSRNVMGMEEYNPAPSNRTLELVELIGRGSEKKKNKTKSFDYWVFDQKMLNRGIVLTVGNENGVEFIRYHVLNSLKQGEEVVTAYVRPCFCEEYDI